MGESQWSELPGDLLKVIEGHLGLYDDKIRFRCVCTHFEQSSADLPDLRQPQPAWLLIPYRTGSVCGLYHPFEKRVLDIDLPEAGEKFFIGNNHGWVVTAQTNGDIHVLNPLTRVRVPLPPRYTFPDVVQYDPNNIGKEYSILNLRCMHPYSLSSLQTRDCKTQKIILSSSPLSNDFTAVAQYNYLRLAYYKAGDDRWREFDGIPTPFCIVDIAFHKGKLYVVSEEGHLMICDDIVSCPVLRKCESTPPYRHIMGDDDHLTNSSEGLMIVQRQTKLRGTPVPNNDIKYKKTTVCFEIYKLDDDRGWVNMESLDYDEILFMGKGSQIMFSQEEFSGTNGNRIYFASDLFQFDCDDIEDIFDNGVCDFEDGSFKPLGYECSPGVVWPLPIWFTPNPY